VFYILSPSLTLDVYEHSGSRFQKVNEHKGREIAGLVSEREVLEVNALLGVVIDWTDVLLVGGVLSLAGDVNNVTSSVGISLSDSVGNIFVEFKVIIFVWRGLPIVDSVEFNENTRIASLVPEVLSSRAVIIDLFDVEKAELVDTNRLIVFALIDVRPSVRTRLVRLLVGFNEFIQIIAPVFPTLLVASVLKPYESALHVLLLGSRSEPKTRVLPDSTLSQLPLRDALINGLVEY